jgi:hypothetical protein
MATIGEVEGLNYACQATNEIHVKFWREASAETLAN